MKPTRQRCYRKNQQYGRLCFEGGSMQHDFLKNHFCNISFPFFIQAIEFKSETANGHINHPNKRMGLLSPGKGKD